MRAGERLLKRRPKPLILTPTLPSHRQAYDVNVAILVMIETVLSSWCCHAWRSWWPLGCARGLGRLGT